MPLFENRDFPAFSLYNSAAGSLPESPSFPKDILIQKDEVSDARDLEFEKKFAPALQEFNNTISNNHKVLSTKPQEEREAEIEKPLRPS